MTPLGLISIGDELRPDVRETLAMFQAAGVQIKVISGDNPQTVAALAKQAGLTDHLKAISGPSLEQMDEGQFRQVVAETTVFGRITPQQKEHIVRTLRDMGYYVAMTGDGVNDVLSLKQANLAIAMQSGSQATRSVADILLLGDSFAALPHAVREGQRVVNGMQDILKLVLARMIYATLIIVLAPMIPYTVRHSGLIAMLTMSIPAFALAAWARPGPTDRHTLGRRLAHFVLTPAITVSLGGLIVFLGVLALGFNRQIDPATVAASARSTLTIFLVLCGLMLLVFVEPPTRWWVAADRFSGDWRPTLLAAGMAVVLGIILAIPMLREIFELQWPTLEEGLLVLLVTVIWVLLARLLWRTRLIERLLGIDLGCDTQEDPPAVVADPVPTRNTV